MGTGLLVSVPSEPHPQGVLTKGVHLYLGLSLCWPEKNLQAHEIMRVKSMGAYEVSPEDKKTC